MKIISDAKKLRNTLIDKGYEPDVFAQIYLETPSARWEDDGIYNLSLKYSDNILEMFINQLKQYLKNNGEE